MNRRRACNISSLSFAFLISLKSLKGSRHYLGLQLIGTEMRYSSRKRVLAGTLILESLLDGYVAL